MAEGFLTTEQVARYLGVSLRTIYNWTSLGVIPCYRLNRNLVRFKLSEVEDWLSKYHQKGRSTRRLPVEE
jgi:PTS system nitrogen regulatory IIA component